MMVFTALLLISAMQEQEELPLDCDNSTALATGPQADMNECAHIAYQAADDEMNQLWPRAIAAVREQDREEILPYRGRPNHYQSLLAAQRAWLTFRDNHCRLNSYKAVGGSMELMLYSFCMRELTETRTAQLRAIVEGD